MERAASWDELAPALLAPLALVDALPPAYAAWAAEAPDAAFVRDEWARCQHVLLSSVLVTWAPELERRGVYEAVCDGWLTPDARTAAGAAVWAHTLGTCTHLLGAPCHEATHRGVERALARLDAARMLACTLQAARDEPTPARQDVRWDELAGHLAGLPSRAANALGPRRSALVDMYAAWHAYLALGWNEALRIDGAPRRLAQLVPRLLRLGAMAPRPGAPSFWTCLLPSLTSADADAYAALYEALDESARAPWVASLATALDALARAQPDPFVSTDGASCWFLSDEARVWAHSSYRALSTVAGAAEAPRWDLVRLQRATASPAWSPLLAWALGAWAMDAEPRATLAELLALWGDVDRVRRATPAHAHMYAVLLLGAMHAVPEREATLRAHAASPTLLHGVSAHLELADPAVRMVGMLVAEVLSAASGAKPPLRFPDSVWAGHGASQEACRVLRQWYDAAPLTWPHATITLGEAPVQRAPVPTPAPTPPAPRAPPATVRLPRRVPPKKLIEVLDDDAAEPPAVAAATPVAHAEADTPSSSLPPGWTVYPMPPDASSESETGSDTSDDDEMPPAPPGAAPAPTPDTSAMLDAALRKKKKAPVYVYELAPLLREHDARAQRVGLKHAEALIRRKTGWGHEIAEHAVDVAHALAGLQDSFQLRNMDERRTAALTALCVAAPAPVIEYVCA